MGFFQIRSFLQKVIGGQTQPLSFGGIQQDGSDAKIVINADGTIDFNGTVNGISSPLSDDTPLMDSVGASGTSSETSRSDHVHPSDTTKANLSSPALTGTPTAPTAAEGTNTTQIATTAFVNAEIATKANLSSPALTGTPTAPTAAEGTNTTQIATTAFVNAEIANEAPRKSASTGTAVNYIWSGTQAQYDAIGTKDANTLYFIV